MSAEVIVAEVVGGVVSLYAITMSFIKSIVGRPEKAIQEKEQELLEDLAHDVAALKEKKKYILYLKNQLLLNADRRAELEPKRKCTDGLDRDEVTQLDFQLSNLAVSDRNTQLDIEKALLDLEELEELMHGSTPEVSETP